LVQRLLQAAVSTVLQAPLQAVVLATLQELLQSASFAGAAILSTLMHKTLSLCCIRMQVAAAFTANVWDIKVAVGDEVSKDQTLMVLEAMKMESPVVAPVAGKVKALRVVQGAMTHAGQLLLVIEEAK
jgi:biotin carboxyl carrier protein